MKIKTKQYIAEAFALATVLTVALVLATAFIMHS